MSQAPYFTQHLRATRPYLRQLSEELDRLRAARKLSPKWTSPAAFDAVADALKSSGIDVAAPTFDTRALSMEVQAALMYSQWLVDGSVVYDFNPLLTEALAHSEVKDICVDDLRFPFDAVYFHFGRQESLTLQSGAPICGAFVFYSPGLSLRVTLVAPRAPDTPWHQRYDEVYDLRVLPQHFSKPLRVAIECAIQDDVADLQMAADTIRKESAQAVTKYGAASEDDLAVGQLLDLKRRGLDAVEQFLSTHIAHHAVYLRCFELIANGLCYATAYRDDVREMWPTNTPEKLRQKADNAPPKESARALSKLNALGFRKVNRVGEAFGAAAENGSAGTVAPHLRKAHWRNQAFGPEMKQRRLRWIRSTRVLGGGADTAERVYEVNPQKL